MDLGGYFITQHSMQTLTSEAVRYTLVYCYSNTTACTLSSNSLHIVEAKVPFLTQASIVLTASQTAPDPSTGVRTITVTGQYPFTFVLPAWTGLNGTISETTSLSY
jgi:hypothetical protein